MLTVSTSGGLRPLQPSIKGEAYCIRFTVTRYTP